MQTANEYLYAILHVVGKIEQNQKQAEFKARETKRGADGSIASKLGSAIKSFIGVRPAAMKNFFTFMEDMLKMAKDSKDPDVKRLKVISESISLMGTSLPSLAEGLGEMGKLRTIRVKRAIQSLQLLYNFMEEAGDRRSIRRIERAIRTFDRMGRSLRRLARPIRSIVLSFAYLGLGILAFAGSILLTSMILKLSKPTDVLLFLGVTIVGLVLMFGILALARRIVDRGTDTIRDIGFGMVALSLGIVAFAFTLHFLPKILGSETGGSIIKSMLLMLGIVAVSVLMFAMIGVAAGLIKKGVGVVFLMSVGLVVLSIAVIGMAIAAKYLIGGALTVGPSNMAKDEKDENKRMILRGLGTMGLIILASIAMFALLGFPAVAGFVMLGVGVSIAMSVALLLLAKSVSKLAQVSSELEGANIAKDISGLIGGTLEGFIEGLSPLSGGKKGVRGIAQFIKNSAKIFAGVGVLMAMSVALSMFAKAITAFAELENMRVITGYKKNGEPIFGEKVNITAVANNINYSISTFLKALITSTDGLTRKEAKAIKKMGRALTGRRGILSAVIQFANALKVYAEFGEKNEIGFVEYDDKGNETIKKVKASVVVDNMIGSFLYFTNRLFTKSEEEFGDGEAGEAGVSGKQKRRIKRMSRALMGRRGILGAVIAFAETLKTFSEFGENNEIPILDAEGKPTGKYLSVGAIADNIVKTLTTFSNTLADKLEKGKVKDASKALRKYDNMINQLSKLSSSIDGLTRMTASISELTEGIGLLGVNLDKLNTDKLGDLADISAAYLAKTNDYSVSNKRIMEGSAEATTTPRATRVPFFPKTTGESKVTGTTTKTNEPNWDVIAAQIGNSVGAQIAAAIKSSQMKFEFSPSGDNRGVIEFE